jgi:M6 family metalloprotease-like protein
MSAIFGETLIFSQENGSDVELVVYGDEFYARYETKDGYTVVYDIDEGQYCYAILLNGRFASSGAPTTKPPPVGIKKHLKESEAVRNEKFEERFVRMSPPEVEGAPHHVRTFGANEGLLNGRRVSEGQVRGLTILVEFDDLSSQVATEDVNAMLNSDNYTRSGNYCSVHEYYRLMSGGKLDYSNTVVGPVKLSRNLSYYKSHLFVQEALDIAVNEHNIDLSEFDSKNQGIVDALNFMYAGRTVYEGELWPHNYHIILNYNGIRTYFYMLTSLGRRPIDLSIGTFCHENGHQLCRFPDMYDYGTRDGDFEKSQGIGRYCLMGSGNHNNGGRTPSPVCAYLRYLVGWYDREVNLNSQGSFEARHGEYATIMKYETDKANEFFLVENRSQLGLDAHLPASGFAVYHCDTLGSNEWEGGTRDKHYQCGLLQADGHLDLENNRNSGDDGDLFGEVTGLVLSDTTTPSTREWDGSDSGLLINDISAAGETVNFVVGSQPVVPIVEGQRQADLLIPDDDPVGVSSEIVVTQMGKLQSIEVTIDITHTYIGDLQVELEAPSGKRALLHDRSGDYQDDIRETFSSDSKTELEDLSGELIAGTWRLHIKDLARRDTGRLNYWGIRVMYEAPGKISSGEASPNLEIPDNNSQGVSSAISISDSGVVEDLEVSVDIVHTYIGDLVVELVAPSGQSAILHNRSGRGKDNLKMVYDRNTASALETLVGQDINGDWLLRIRDLAAIDTGTLEKWTLKIMYS